MLRSHPIIDDGRHYVQHHLRLAVDDCGCRQLACLVHMAPIYHVDVDVRALRGNITTTHLHHAMHIMACLVCNFAALLCTRQPESAGAHMIPAYQSILQSRSFHIPSSSAATLLPKVWQEGYPLA